MKQEGHKDAHSEVVKACRVLHASHLGDTVWGFAATRDAQGRGVWITTDAVGFDEVTSASVILVAFDGNVLEGTGAANEEVGLALAPMSSRDDIGAVVHAHSLYATAFGASDRVLSALSHEGCHLTPPGIGRWGGAGTGDGSSRAGTGLVEALGSSPAVFTVGHGLIAVGESLSLAVAIAVYLEKACHLQLIAGDGVDTVSQDENLLKRSGQASRPLMSWDYLRRGVSQTTGAPA
jgi:L-fuculose-phosphate aldolase